MSDITKVVTDFKKFVNEMTVAEMEQYLAKDIPPNSSIKSIRLCMQVDYSHTSTQPGREDIYIPTGS